MSRPPESTVFTVSQLNTTVRQLLEMEMGQIWLSAEISNFSQPASGHWYFTLKDNSAQVSCAMFRNSNQRLSFRPQNGHQVLVKATLTLYEPRGNYQLIVQSMHPAGNGLLQQQFELLKEKLNQEGLFAAQYKQPLPVPAKQVGVITSATGAALHDILQVLQRRDPSLPIIIYPTAVQGKEAIPAIVRAIEVANWRAECDVLIVGRGGGSLEDLWCFNDERVARAIFASVIPVVSAVGHETDVTIADFVADQRAPTPSAAAEIISRNQTELVRQLQHQQQRLDMAMDYYLAQCQQRSAALLHRLQQQHPQLRLARQQTTLENLRYRLDNAISQQQARFTQRFQRLSQRLRDNQPANRLLRHQQTLQQGVYRLQHAMQQQLSQDKQRFSTLTAQLSGVSPLAALARGFSVTTSVNGTLVSKTAQVTPGEKLTTRVDDGWLESEITAIHPLKKKRIRKNAKSD
ncbi:MAG: Exodeoxyribonuclease 7 large subunit [Candidatus Erwinia impunctatus]|nr:Exodeoxyribonuclease 7 large subunit [Culicoides impunctatus]